MSKDKTRTLKNVSFNLNNEKDMKMLEYAESFDSFGSYIKDLIKKDMESKDCLSRMANSLEELVCVLKDKNISLENHSVEISSDKIDTTIQTQEEDLEGKAIISNIMNLPINKKSN